MDKNKKIKTTKISSEVPAIPTLPPARTHTGNYISDRLISVSTPKPTIAIASSSSATKEMREMRESLMNGRSQVKHPVAEPPRSPQLSTMIAIDSRKEQDRILGDIELSLGHLHTTATDINHELHSQTKIIDDLDTKMDTANTNLTVANTGVSRLINRVKSGYYPLYILIGVLLIILAIIIYVLVRY